MTEKMKIGWANYGLDIAPDPVARGYQNVVTSVLKELLVHPRVQMVDQPPKGAPIIHVAPPHRFVPVPGFRNVIFSMWEGEKVPRDYVLRLKKAQVQVVPSNFCSVVWQRSGLPRPHIAPLGVELGLYRKFTSERPELNRGANNTPARARRRPATQGRLRFLFLGAKVQRKGWHIVEPAWRQAFENSRTSFEVQLYVKVIDKERQGVRSFYEGGVVLDTRDLTKGALAELYHSADVFVFPSLAEGFGLPALEAMAAGCLVIAPPTGGLQDFLCPENCLLLEKNAVSDITYAETTFTIPSPAPEDVSKLLRVAYETWGTKELEHMRRVGWFDARAYTWERTANKVVEACLGPVPAPILIGGLR